jgi:hypothetical protein
VHSAEGDEVVAGLIQKRRTRRELAPQIHAAVSTQHDHRRFIANAQLATPNNEHAACAGRCTDSMPFCERLHRKNDAVGDGV